MPVPGRGGDLLGIQRSFDDLGAPLFAVPFCVLDLETTGGSAQSCAITEIGAVRYEAGELTGTFHTLVNPETAIPPTIVVLTGITEAMVVEAPTIAEALPSLLEFIGDAVVVGHNIRFDMSFLDAAARRLGYGRLANKTSDTAALARRLLAGEVRNHKLRTVAAHLRSPVTPTHRALDDARATAHVFFELLGRAGAIGVTHLDDLLRLPRASGAPHYAKLRLTDHLPRRPGVYLFRDRTGEVIYVGKAKNLRTRVRSYFYGDRRRRITQMMRDLEAVDHIVCPTELEASVTEVRLISRHQPRYNRRSRQPAATHWLRLTDEEFPRLSMVRSPTGRALAHLGPFRHRRGAETVMHALWDAVPIRRCTGKGPHPGCRFSQLGVALCPCDGSVPADTYREVVARLIGGLDEPERLLDPLQARMQRLSEDLRYEEAAEVRDRHQALARALDTRLVWRKLTRHGILRADDASGEGIVVGNGRLLASWGAGQPTPLHPLAPPAEDITETPPTVAAAEEMWLVWRWLDRDGVVGLDPRPAR